MPAFTSFLQANVEFLLFSTGLAFFSMGLAAMLESRRPSDLPVARAIGLLAAFGALQGLRSWVEMARLAAEPQDLWLSPLALQLLSLALLILASISLLAYGSGLLFSSGLTGRTATRFTAGVAALWAGLILAAGLTTQASAAEWLAMGDVLSHYVLAAPGSLVTAWALARQRKVSSDTGLPVYGGALLWVAIAFLAYGVAGHLFTRPSGIFPSSVVNNGLFASWFGIPVELLEAALATAIAVTMIRALQTVDLESHRRMNLASGARLTSRLAAQEEERRRQDELAQLNRECQASAWELRVLYELSRILASTLELNTLLREAVRHIVTTVRHVKSASIWLQDDANGDLNFMTACNRWIGPGGEEILGWERPAGDAQEVLEVSMATGCTVGRYPLGTIAPVLGVAPTQKITDGQPQDVLPQTVSIPLVWKGRTRGAMILEANSGEGCFTATDLPLVGAMSVQLSIAIENAILYEEAKSRETVRGELLRRIVSEQAMERQRIARELHDETAQTLTALSLGLKGVVDTVRTNPDLAVRQLEELRAETTQALEALRRLVADLRPGQLDDLGLLAALRLYIEGYRERVPMQVELTVQGTPRRLKAEVESVIFRIAQEALVNAARHAKAQRVKVEMSFRDSSVHRTVRLTVTDNGVGFDPNAALRPQDQRKAFGLLGIQERARLVGAQCQIVSRLKHGTRVRVQVSMGREVADHEEDNGLAG